jgi:hypothetical protein
MATAEAIFGIAQEADSGFECQMYFSDRVNEFLSVNPDPVNPHTWISNLFSGTHFTNLSVNFIS